MECAGFVYVLCSILLLVGSLKFVDSVFIQWGLAACVIVLAWNRLGKALAGGRTIGPRNYRYAE